MTKLINWNREKLAALTKARDETSKQSFAVKLPGEREETTFARADADHIIKYVGDALADAPDQPRLPYKEGQEGQ